MFGRSKPHRAGEKKPLRILSILLCVFHSHSLLHFSPLIHDYFMPKLQKIVPPSITMETVPYAFNGLSVWLPPPFRLIGISTVDDLACLRAYHLLQTQFLKIIRQILCQNAHSPNFIYYQRFRPSLISRTEWLLSNNLNLSKKMNLFLQIFRICLMDYGYALNEGVVLLLSMCAGMPVTKTSFPLRSLLTQTSTKFNTIIGNMSSFFTVFHKPHAFPKLRMKGLSNNQKLVPW